MAFHPIRKLVTGLFAAVVFSSGSHPAIAATVAIVDTGLDPGIVGGSLAGPGYDFYNDDPEAIDDNPARHGTSSGLAAVQEAPNIKLLPVKAYSASFQTTSAILQQAFEFTAQQGVRAASHSIGSITNTPLSALQAVTNSGAILVVQSGNAGAPSPTGDARKVPNLGGRGIVAGGIIGDSPWPANNRAGDLADHYLVADVRGPIGGWVGTSMATPRVAAVAAAVAESFPFLAPEQVVQVLFDSAIDLGAPGVDSDYGHGLVDYNAAMSAVGEGSIPSGGGGGDGGGGGGSTGLAVAALAVGGAVAYTMLNKEEDLKKTIFVDKFGRAFNIDLANRATARSNAPMHGLFGARQNPMDLVSMDRSGQTLAFVSQPKRFDPTRPSALSLADPVDETRWIGFRSHFSQGDIATTMALNADLSGEFGALSFDDPQDRTQARFLYNQVFTTPVLGYSSQGSSFRFAWDGDGDRDFGSHRLGLAVIDDQEQHGLESNSVLYENSMQRENYRLGFQLGTLLEDGSLLGGASDGAFSADETNTYYIGLNGAWSLTPDVTLMGGYFHGMSRVKANPNALLDQFSDIQTEGYGLGLLVDEVFSHRDTVGVAWSSPMQATDGSARLTLPVSQNRYTGEIGYERSTLSFDGANQESVFEAYYAYDLGINGDVFAHFSYTTNPVIDPDLDRDRTFYLGWKRDF